MRTFIGVFRYEYRMSIHRLSLWLAVGILALPNLISMFGQFGLDESLPKPNEFLSFAGSNAYMLNLLLPVVGGILAADRLSRDAKIGVDELLLSTPLNRRVYLAGKYCGTLFSIVTPVFVVTLLINAIWGSLGIPLSILPASVLAFLGINLPAYAFITAFSLACPLILPVRVYQVLFTGYWFWGNFLNPEVLPTLNGTYLTPSGFFALSGLFGGFIGGGGPSKLGAPAQVDAWINLAVLGLCIACALFAAERYLAWHTSRK